MSEKRFYILAHDEARMRASNECMTAPDGWHVRIEPPKKRREQEEKYHAMIADIAKHSTYAGRKWDDDDMKRILVDEFADVMREAGTPLHGDSRLIPSENGRRVIQLGVQTRDFWVKEASEFIEFLYAYGSEREVVWSEPRRRDRIDADTGEITEAA